ncbi:MAG: NAD-dependent deacylase [Ardenticatenaceae bacterium]|nr:NAD-dependent deacylase [Anaerolineales bacterium]MCB8921704.1 NAD-dependent deacylase [Ardenticatenaceae bacterium]MCB8990777.1 NAD-dependent deacylase [Ardenticatenaceae bacterium]MCB9003264.1 NAD-dependent deacylase [Ardenticatenaceae bacterium]
MKDLIPDELRKVLRNAQHIVVLTGAGTSAESGVPTFREAQTGLWAQYDPQELATPQAFRRNPKLVWEWYIWRRELVTNAEPNPGHFALAEMEKLLPKFTLITQNVDGLHQRAGSLTPIELHGNIMQTKCFEDGETVTEWAETGEVPPRCPRCGGLLRPDVVWFGESLPFMALNQAIRAARQCDVFLSVGTSALVQPAASLPVEAMQAKAVTVEVNPQATPLTQYMDFVLARPSGTALPELLKQVWGIELS